MKRVLKICLWSVAICLLTFIYLLYFGQNRYSLMLNQGCIVPKNLTEISINVRRGVGCLLFGRSGFAFASCVTNKDNLNAWLMEVDFEIIYHPGNTTQSKFYKSLDSLPLGIKNHTDIYEIQLVSSSSNTKHVSVVPLDEDQLTLLFDMDWN